MRLDLSNVNPNILSKNQKGLISKIKVMDYYGLESIIDLICDIIDEVDNGWYLDMAEKHNDYIRVTYIQKTIP